MEGTLSQLRHISTLRLNLEDGELINIDPAQHYDMLYDLGVVRIRDGALRRLGAAIPTLNRIYCRTRLVGELTGLPYWIQYDIVRTSHGDVETYSDHFMRTAATFR